MIYVTGDCHQNFERFNKKIFPEQEDMAKDDYVIICGDFGGIWNKDVESNQEKALLNTLENRSFTTLFVDGNHENFDRLYEFPVEEWHCGKVHKIRPSVIHLMRGQVYNIDDKTFFTFGGAASHDIQGGLLDPDAPDFQQKRKLLNRGYLPYRIKHISWWEQEMPSEEEMEEGFVNLEKHGNCVDFIVTHCCASSTQALISHGTYQPDILTNYLEKVRQNTRFKKWFFGHYHDNRNVNMEEIMLYEQIIRIA